MSASDEESKAKLQQYSERSSEQLTGFKKEGGQKAVPI